MPGQMMAEHAHPHPPGELGPVLGISKDASLPEREIITPMGTAKFRSRDLEENGYRWTFSKASNSRMVEIVYLKEDGSTGTIIADVDSLFDTRIEVKDDKPVCIVTFKFMRKVTNPVNLQCASVPITTVSNGVVGKMLTQLLEFFLERTFGKEAV